jgi:hypothetical protein
LVTEAELQGLCCPKLELGTEMEDYGKIVFALY